MSWIVLIAAAFVLLVVVLAVVAWIVGSRLPEEHSASRSITLRQAPEAVWAVIADCEGHAGWAKGVTRVERMAEQDGREVWRQHMGRNSFVMETTTTDPPRRLVRSISDDHGPFSGSWTYEIAPAGEGSRVQLTETGRIKNPIPRFMMRYMMGEDTYLKMHLKSLGKKFGEDVKPA